MDQILVVDIKYCMFVFNYTIRENKIEVYALHQWINAKSKGRTLSLHLSSVACTVAYIYQFVQVKCTLEEAEVFIM